MSVTVAFRPGGGPLRGFGHVRRCLTLADAIRKLGSRAVLILTRGDETAGVRATGIETVSVDAAELTTLRETIVCVSDVGASVLVVDSYDVSTDALERVPVPLGVMVDAPTETALPAALVTSAVSADPARWRVRDDTRLLLGPRYALVRETFAVRQRRVADEVRRVLVTTGGTDMAGSIVQLAEAVHRTLPAATIDVIVGPYFSPAALRALHDFAARTANVVLHDNVSDMRDMMIGADLALTSGGQTTFELAATGTPTVAVCLADNQAENLIGLAAAGTLVDAGSIYEPDSADRIEQQVSQLAASRERREEMSRAGRQAVDGEGARRVADELLQLARAPHAAL